MTARSTPEWIGASPDAKIPPLSPEERGRGARISAGRLADLERFCALRLSAGDRQKDIAAQLGASRSRVSRWCIAGLRRYGLPTDHRLLRTGAATPVQMMWARIDVRGKHDCWLWRGAVKANGYGSLNIGGRTHNAHRLVFETLVAPIPAGRVIDHICCNPRCVNPHHLQLATQSANLTLAAARRLR